MTWGSRFGPLAIFRCCRDWPVFTLMRVGRCGACGEVPERTDKTIEQYMDERKVRTDG